MGYTLIDWDMTWNYVMGTVVANGIECYGWNTEWHRDAMFLSAYKYYMAL